MPEAIQRLACYENTGASGETRVFHFLTIEAKKARTSTDDPVAKYQNLNNSSQALHNMFEFFREAGQQSEDDFFTKVRFFSVVASTEGLVIRIHRATREPEDGTGQGLIMKDKTNYPLRFEYREFSKLQKDTFERQVVSEIFERILVNYGENVLHTLLKKAAVDIMAKLDNDPQVRQERADVNYYRYGQINIRANSKKGTPAVSQAPSVTNMSIDMMWNETLTPTQSRAATPTRSRAATPKQMSSLSGKRCRRQSDDGLITRNTRQRHN